MIFNEAEFTEMLASFGIGPNGETEVEPEPIGRAQIEGTEGGTLTLDWANDGDVWLTVQKDGSPLGLRFCTPTGGGSCRHTRIALRRLMEAIKRDGGRVVMREASN